MNLDFLRQIPLFLTHTPEEAQRILDLCKSRVLKKGEILVNQGDKGQVMYILEAGELLVFQQAHKAGEVQLATLTPGAVVGEMSLIDPAPRSASVRAVTSAVVQEFKWTDFVKLKNQLDPAVFKMMRQIGIMLCERLRQTNEEAARLVEDPRRLFATGKPRAGESIAEHEARVQKKVEGFWAGLKALFGGGDSDG